MPTDQKLRHQRSERKAARRRRRGRRPNRLSRMGPAFEQGAERQREFFEPVHAEAKALSDRARAESRARQDLRELDGHEPTMRRPDCKPRHGGGKQTSTARRQRRDYLRLYRRKMWPRRTELQLATTTERRFREGELRDVEVTRRVRWPVARRRLITLKLAREVAEANVGVRRMQAEADARAEEQVPKGLRGRLARLLRRRREAPDATPEAARAAERLYGRPQTEILAQQLGQRALSRQQRKTGRRFFRRHP